VRERYMLLAKCYVLGDKLLDGDFMDIVIDAMIDSIDGDTAFISVEQGRRRDLEEYDPPTNIINYIYENTHSGSKARELIADLCGLNAGYHWFEDLPGAQDLHPDFMRKFTGHILHSIGQEEDYKEFPVVTRSIW
jgi:hypothetical protein